MLFTHVYVCISLGVNAHRSWKRVLGLLELELEVSVSHLASVLGPVLGSSESNTLS